MRGWIFQQDIGVKGLYGLFLAHAIPVEVSLTISTAPIAPGVGCFKRHPHVDTVPRSIRLSLNKFMGNSSPNLHPTLVIPVRVVPARPVRPFEDGVVGLAAHLLGAHPGGLLPEA